MGCRTDTRSTLAAAALAWFENSGKAERDLRAGRLMLDWEQQALALTLALVAVDSQETIVDT